MASGGQAIKLALQVGSVVVLSRLLTPHDYGLVAMVAVVVGVADIFRDFGLSSAAVQAPSLSDRQRDNLFWINTLSGVGLSVVAWFTAPLVASLYGVEELTSVMRALAVLFTLNGLATQYRAGLTRGMRFGALAASDIVGSALGLLAGVMGALAGWGYHALIAQQVTQVLVMTLSTVVVSRWLPARPTRGADMSGLLRYGWHMVGSQVINYVGKNADTVIVGGRFGPSAAGLYNRGYQLLMVPMSQVLAPATSVALPVLSRLQDQPARYAAFVVRAQLLLGYSLVAALGLVAGAAQPLVAVALGDQWGEVTPILRLFAVAGACDGLAFVGYWIYLSKGLTADLRRFTLISTGLRLVCLLVGSQWGVVGVAAGFALAPALAWPLSLWIIARRSRMDTRPLLEGAGRVLVLAATTGLVAWWASRLTGSGSEILALVTAVAGGAIGYFAVVGLLPAWRADFLAGVRTVMRGIRH